MVARFAVTNNTYRYGFNGKEKENDINAGGGDYDYGFRIYDARLARFLSVDPITRSYPWYTPYQFAGNKPIQCIDRDGLEEIEVHSASITGEIEALKLKGATEDEIRWFVYEKVNVHSYSTPKGAAYAGKHFGYTQDGKIVEVTNPTTPLIIWGYRPINSVNKKGKLYISGYEKYKVYDATKPIEEPKTTAPAKVVPKSDKNSSILDDISDLGSSIDNYMRHAGPNLEGQYGFDHGGKQILGGTVAVVTAPFAIAGGGVGAVLGYVALANGLDDIGTNNKGESVTQQLATDQSTKTMIGNIKLFATLTTATTGGISGVKTFASTSVTSGTKAANAISTANDVLSATPTIVDKVKSK